MFFVDFNMPDTFLSWFLVTELHVWMIMLRYMADENYGKVVRNFAVNAMWEDTKARIDQLGVSITLYFLNIYIHSHIHMHFHHFLSIVAGIKCNYIMLLQSIRSKLKNEQIREVSYQFNAAIIGYDEGITTDDKTLAGALWRRFFVLECNNPEHIETLIIYIRKQVRFLFQRIMHSILYSIIGVR